MNAGGLMRTHRADRRASSPALVIDINDTRGSWGNTAAAAAAWTL